MPTVEIIIVKYNAPELEKQCVRSILECTKYPYSLTLHDNYPQNENLSKLWNELIGRSKSDYICLLNSDTKVSSKWLEKLLEVFNREEKVGIVGPSTNSSKNWQEELSVIPERYSIFDYGKELPKGYLCGFCLVFPKSIWEEVGGFDESFGFYGQEGAFIKGIMKAGYRQLWRQDVFVWHKGGGSSELAEKRGEFNEKRERKKGREKLNG